MSNVAKLAVPLLLIAAAAGAALYFLNREDVTPIAPPSGYTLVVMQPKAEPKQPAVVAVKQTSNEPDRVVANAAKGNSHSDAAQGVKGRVLHPSGEPAVGIPVLLMENGMSNPIDMFLKNKTGQITPPLATAVTVDDGSFALGILKEGQTVDLRVVSEEHPELVRSPLTLRGGDWLDAGDLQLEQGLIVQGRVVETLTKAAVQNATVYLNASNRTHVMAATPGR